MTSRIIYIGIILLVAFSLCISNGSETQTPEKTETPEITETPSTAPPTTTSASTTQPPTPAPTTSAPTPPGKKELVVNEEKTQNNIAITISKLYYVNEPKYGNSGPLEDHLRVELSIRNDSESTVEFYPNITSVVEDDLKNQYVVLSMPSSKDWGEIEPGEAKEGYITFPRIDENAKTIAIVLRNDTTAIEFLIDIRNL